MTNEDMKSNVGKIKFKVDQKGCIGCGACVAICDKFFSFNDEGKSQMSSQPETSEDIACCEEAMEACCVGVISKESVE